jgi:hypothetical protein
MMRIFAQDVKGRMMFSNPGGIQDGSARVVARGHTALRDLPRQLGGSEVFFHH